MLDWTPVIGFDGYLISTEGHVCNQRTNRILKQNIGTHGYYYVTLRSQGKNYYRCIHRMMANAWLPNTHNLPYVDHRDRNRLNNTLSNLRFASASLQNHNRSKGHGASSCYFGVSKCKNGWRAKIMIHGRDIHIGCSSSEEAAAAMYDAKAREIWGEDARTNGFA